MQFRMANWRHNVIVEAQLRVIVLVVRRTAEGDTMRVPIELPLVRDRTATLFLTWTAMHRIDESSPFHGPDALRRLCEQEATLFLSLSGMDETVSQTVHARYVYSLDDIVWDARFADVLNVLPDGTREINYHNFHKVVTREELARSPSL
jgi:inward rectifier potassium channel